MPRNFDFVAFPRSVNNNYKNIDNRYGEYSGIINLQINTVDNLYTGDGFWDYDQRMGFSTSTKIENDRFIIPGSSIKGALRHVARAVSDGCIDPSEASRDLNIRPSQKSKCSLSKNREEDSDHICVVCDMFGMMGLASKVIVSDFISDTYKKVKCNVPARFTPNINSPVYKDENARFHKGYKFYCTYCEPGDEEKNDIIYAVEKGTTFNGEIRFTGLDENELCLLMYSLGLDDCDEGRHLSHKLGGYRSAGFGTVNFICQKIIVNGEEKTTSYASCYAHKYTTSCSIECYNHICKLEEIMEYRD